jgi:2,3-bisphosphoglycerate-dependent phosphoglycerate mutase
MILYFVRHAQSTNNLLYSTTGSDKGRSEDPELSELGREQTKLLGAMLGSKVEENTQPGGTINLWDGLKITHIYTSLMIRAIETALVISAQGRIKPVAMLDLHETGGICQRVNENEFVGLPGKPRSYFEERYPGLTLPDGINEQGWWNKPFEPQQLRLPRAKKVIAELQKKHGKTEDQVVFVSHGAFYSVFMTALLGIEENKYFFNMYNSAITRIDFSDKGLLIQYQNRFDHLPPNMISL